MKRKHVLKSMIPVYLIVLSALLIFTHVGNKAITVLSQNAVVSERRVVVIDAGHGGIDGGATSCTGVLESKTNLEIALSLRDLLNLLGVKTVMIRTSDVSVYTSGDTIAAKKASDLKERVRIVNEYEDSLLLSIHQNYFSDNRYCGAQVFYGPAGQSNSLASIMQQSLINYLNPNSNREAKKADGIYLMQHINGTGLLIECGFISNPEEEAKLQSKNYQLKLCAVISTVTSAYLNT